MLCKSKGCKSPAIKRGFCDTHYARYRRAGKLPGSRKCTVRGCRLAAVSRGLCPNHHMKLRRTGTPLGIRNWGEAFTHPLYSRWRGMRYRCSEKTHLSYKRYGGAGIRVCDRWFNDFWAFVDDMGMPPTRKHTLDRIDTTKGYSPKNCRWATPTEQLMNRRICQVSKAIIKNIKKRYDAGKSALSLSKELDVSYNVVRDIVRGKTWNKL